MDEQSVLEFRQYTTRPGRREDFIALFDREFVDTQVAVGIDVIGQFRDEDDPDRFLWLRAFPDMPRRAAALTAFYVDSPAWRTHGEHATRMLADTSDVLLLRLATQNSNPPARSLPINPSDTPTRLLATIYPLHDEANDFADFFAERVRPVLQLTGATPIWACISDRSPNDFPMPVRNDYVFVWFALFETAGHLQAHLDELTRSRQWSDEVLPDLAKRLAGPIEQRRAVPTARSGLR